MSVLPSGGLDLPSDFASYLALLRLVDDASKDLGLSHLTASDKHVLLVMTEFAGKNHVAGGFTYAKYCDLVEQDEVVSRAQFFKSLDRLLSANIIMRKSPGRKANYLLRV